MPFTDSTDELEAKVVHDKRDVLKPWIVLKPRRFLFRVLNYYATEEAAKRACRRWNNKNA